MRGYGRLNRVNDLKIDTIGGELSFERVEQVQPTASLDQIGIGDGIRRPCEQIRDPDLRSHRAWKNGERQIERSRDVLEDVRQQRVGDRDGALPYFQEPFHAFLAMALKEK